MHLKTTHKPGPKIETANSDLQLDQTKINRECKEDPFENAFKENLRIEAKLDQEQERKRLFEISLKQRLKAYKKAQHQINEDCQLQVDTTNKLHFVIQPNKKIVNIELIQQDTACGQTRPKSASRWKFLIKCYDQKM